MSTPKTASKRIMVYGSTDGIRMAMKAFEGDGLKLMGRNSKYFPTSGCEECDGVIVVVGSMNADLVAATYREKRPDIQVKMWPSLVPSKLEGVADAGSDEKNGSDGGDGKAPVDGDAEKETLVETVANALFGKARAKGYSKETLRAALRERGFEEVGKELGVNSSDELKALVEKGGGGQ